MYAKAPAAPLLDLPFRFNLRGQLRDMADFVFLGGYHGRPVAGCYNSFNLPVQRELEMLAGRLPDPRAADALHALGFGALVVHEEILLPRQREGWRANVEQLVAAGRLVPLGEAPEHRLYGLASPVPVAATFEALAPAGAPTEVLEARPPQANLAMPFRNGSAATYRHPDPIEPTALVVRWYDGGGALVAEYRSRALLPVALGSGVAVVRAVPTAVPAAAGEYEVTVAPAATPAVVVTRSRVRVEPAAGSRGGRS